MPAYAVGRIRTKDWSWLEEYGPVVSALIEKYGGRYLVRGGAVDRLEGEEELADAHVILEFSSMEQARAWYDDPEYAPMIELRQAHADIEFVILEGLGES